MFRFRQLLARWSATIQRRHRGFTLISLTTGVAVSSVVMVGAWMAMVNYKAAMKVSANDRNMDQYAASTMSELTNILSWSWGGEQIQGGANMRWKFLMDDQVNQYGTMQQYWENIYYHRDLENFITVTYSPNQGILYNGSPARWSVSQGTHWYQWGGSAPRGGSIRNMDARDHMSVESMTMEFNRFPDAGFIQSPMDRANQQMVVQVNMVMHYTVDNSSIIGLFSGNRGYVRERIYTTQIAMRNWDTPKNIFRQNLLHAIAGGTGGA